MGNTAPFEIIAAPYELWIAAVGTAFPDVDAAPAAGWTKVGTLGKRNYDEEGVTVQHSETIETFTPAGATGPVKAFRTAEGLVISLTLADLSLEQYAHALNQNAITDVAAGAGTAGTKTIGLTRGLDVARRALLLRGESPYGDAMAMQYEVPIAFQSGSPEPSFRKGEPAMLALEFTALEDPGAATEAQRFGRLKAQTAPPV